MASFCLPKQLADTLKDAAKRGEIDIAQMYEMTTQQRRDLFTKWVDELTAIDINAGFEKAMISSQQTALKDWAEAVFDAKKKDTPRYRDIVDKINSLEDLGVLTPENEDAFLQDLVASKLGATVTAEEAATISKLTNRMQELSEKQSDFNTPTIEYFKAKKELDDYLDSITPSSKLKVATSTIGRGTMLASIKSPILNIESNTIQAFLTAMERRIVNKNLSGTNGKYGLEYMKFVNKVYKETGYDLTRMTSLKSRRKVLGENYITSQGEGKVRAVGRFYEDVVFKRLLGQPDVAFASAHFADSANLMSTQIAKNKGLEGIELQEEALRIFKDATRIEPTTTDGEIVRENAIADATRATYTNDSTYSDVALAIRGVFNAASGDLRLGDQLMPFVKTPANVIGAGIDASGILLPVDFSTRAVKTVNAIVSGENVTDATLDNFRGFSRKAVRAGMGFTFAFILSTLFEPEDFIGEYPVSQKERELLRLKNATTNSVKIGDKWVSLDYFGALAAPLVGILYAKKYGNDKAEKGFYYYAGVGRQALQIPGFEDFYSTVKGIKENFSSTSTLDENIAASKGFAIDYVRARLIPGLVYDIARATDTVERERDRDDAFSYTKSTIPGLRQTLDVRKTIFGDEVKSEGWRTILFGARVKTANDDVLTNEIARLAETGNLPAITDLTKTSTRAKNLKKQLGDEEYKEAVQTFRDYFKQDMLELIYDDYYLEGDDTEKKEMIDKVKSDAFNDMLDLYGYEEPEDL